jgi:hypothetical protein
MKSLFRSLDKIGSNWTSLGRERILEWPEGQEPDPEALITAVRENLNKRHPKLARVPEALRSIIAEWEATRKGQA